MRRPGCSTWCCLDRSLPDALRELATRTDTIEVFADAAHDILNDTPLPDPGDDVSLSVHAPTADINIASTRETVRVASVDLVSSVCRRAAEMGASHVVVHPGFCPWRQQEKESFSALLRSLDDLARVQEESGVTIAVENMGGWEMCHFRDPGLLAELGGRGLSFCLDVGHAFLNGVLWEFLSLGTPCSVHVHDNRGKTDDHLPPGMGCIDFSALLRRLPPDVPWIIEVPEMEMVDQGLLSLVVIDANSRQSEGDTGDPPGHPRISRPGGKDDSASSRIHRQKRNNCIT